MLTPIRLFALATLAPILLVALAGALGGWWALLALGYMTAMVATLDEVVIRVTPPLPETEFPAANALSVGLAIGHFALLGLTVAALAGDGIGFFAKLATFAAAGLWFGQVSNSNAHELIHRGSRALHTLGKAVYVSLLFGHHTSAHLHVHHRHVGTRADPNTARLGEGYYHFARRAWLGSFREGRDAETARLRRIGRPLFLHPYAVYVGGALLMLLLALRIGGIGGLFAYLALCGFAQSQLLLSDYVQHYGLSRQTDATGKAEPVAPGHSWNSPHWFSSALMLNAPRHSDHHAHPARPYVALTLPADAPMLPRALPVMACVALWPDFWRSVMDPRVRAWQSAASPGAPSS
jgi:alkane 1-monooxygenase